MMNFKNFTLIVSVLLLSALFIQAQQSDAGLFTGSARETDNSNDLRVGINMGTSFFSNFNGQGGMASWIQPSLSKPLSKRFTVSFSTSFMQAFNVPVLTVPEGSEAPVVANRNMSFSTISVSGIYAVNPSLTIIASGYKQLPINRLTTEANPRALDFSSEGVMVGFHYRVNENVHISGSIDYSRGTPAGYYRRTVFNDPFHSPFTW
jgi:hypothetical protein